jgi:hypothetical protein
VRRSITSRPECGGIGEGELRCTTRRQSPRITESRVVLYRWHPWHGRSVFIVASLNKGEPVFRCALEPGDWIPTPEVRQWMFDPAVLPDCGGFEAER